MKKIFKYGNKGIFIICFLVVLAVDMFVSYSSGDDLYHLTLAQNSTLWEFIQQCGTSRLSKKISLYYIMRSDIMVWRVLNAAIFTLLFYVLSQIVQIIRQAVEEKDIFWTRVVLLVSLCFAHISIIGFSVFWVTGTQDYLWPLTFGMISLIPEIQYCYGKKISPIKFVIAVICALWGGLGQEQISFMLLCISAMFIGIGKYKKSNCDNKWGYCIILLLIRSVCFLYLLLAPTNQKRMSSSLYYTGYENLSIFKRLFLTTQWELSAFANEMKLLFIAIWLVLAVQCWRQYRKESITAIVMILGTIPAFVGGNLLNDLGITTMTDMGASVEAIVKATDNTVSFSTMSVMNWVGFIWWFISVWIITPYLLKKKPVCCILYGVGIILPMMQIVSSGMYVSGGRVFFASAVLFCLITGLLLSESSMKKYLPIAAGIAVVFGVYELGIDAVYFINNMI